MKALLICGILSPVLYAIADLLAGLQLEDYSFRDQTISELGAIGAPSRPLFTVLLLVVYGLKTKPGDENETQGRTLNYFNKKTGVRPQISQISDFHPPDFRSLSGPRKRPQFLGMIPDIGDNAVALLRSATVAVRFGLTQNPGLEFIDSVKNRHPTFLDRLDAQTEICTELGVGLAGEGRSQERLFRRA